MDIIVLGREVDARLRLNMPPNVELFSDAYLLSRARTELEWLIGELTSATAANVPHATT